MRKSAMSRRAIGTATLLAVSWWFLLNNSGGAAVQIGPFSSSAACAKVAQRFNTTSELGTKCLGGYLLLEYRADRARALLAELMTR